MTADMIVMILLILNDQSGPRCEKPNGSSEKIKASKPPRIGITFRVFLAAVSVDEISMNPAMIKDTSGRNAIVRAADFIHSSTTTQGLISAHTIQNTFSRHHSAALPCPRPQNDSSKLDESSHGAVSKAGIHIAHLKPSLRHIPC